MRGGAVPWEVTVRHISSILASSVLFLVLVHAPDARARSQRNLPYRADQTWTTAVRLLRVDMGFEIVERDQEARFIIFTYRQGNQNCTATLEIAERLSELGIEGVSVVVSVPAMPTYIELHLIDELERKLRTEVGIPIHLTPPEPPPPPARANNSHDDDEDEDDDNDNDNDDNDD
jgi:hypothetical protein